MNTDKNPRHSAYAGTADDWRKFLSCWHHEYDELTCGQHDASLVKRDVLADGASLNLNDEAARDEITIQQRRLGFKLPQSYVDFLIAYHPTELSLKDADFLHVSAVDAIEAVFPGWAHALAEVDMDASDDDYFTYGVTQVDTTRTRYLESSIAVGMHDTGTPFLLVLHPEVVTSDGEMETEAFFHAGSRRTPSFAEMMRYLYFREVRRPLDAPAISQEMMRGTCADLMPMKGVWWK